MAYTVHPAVEADLETLVPMFSTYLGTLGSVGMRYDPCYEGVADTLLGRIKSRRALLAVAEEDGSILGFICVSISRVSGEYRCEGGGVIGHVDDIYVAPEHRGRGIATALADCAETWLAEAGIGAVQLHVHFENPAGRAFWRSRGMEPMSALCYKKLNAPRERKNTEV